MKKFLVITVLALFLALSPALLTAQPALAANDLTFNADTTINIPDLNINLTIKNNSVVDSMTTNTGSINFTFSTGNYLVIESEDKRNMAVNPAIAGQSFSCGSVSTLTIIPQAGVSGTVVTLTPSTATCSSGGGSNTGGSPGGSGTPTTQPETTTPTTPVTTPAPTAPTPIATVTSAAQQLQNISADTAIMVSGKVENILTAMGANRNSQAETSAMSKYTAPLVSGLKNVTTETKTAITNFVNYGTPTTKVLGAGERAGVLNSYKTAFGKVPSKESEWSDAIKIANGRWPTERSTTAEAKASAEFKKVYKRTPNMQQPNDNAAVTVISYGLRPSARNTNSEKAAIKSFKATYNHAPVSALAWDIVRAIAYSGAKR